VKNTVFQNTLPHLYLCVLQVHSVLLTHCIAYAVVLGITKYCAKN
jgi:hypothetical protein